MVDALFSKFYFARQLCGDGPDYYVRDHQFHELLFSTLLQRMVLPVSQLPSVLTSPACGREKCSKLCGYLGHNASCGRSQSPTPTAPKLGFSNSGHERLLSESPPFTTQHNSEGDQSKQSKCTTTDETPFRLESPDITSASAYATPCGKEYSFVLSGVLDPDVYKLCALMYRKYLLDWVNGKLSLFPEPFPPKMESLLDVPFPTSPDGMLVEDFYWDEPIVISRKPVVKKQENAHVVIFVAFLLGAILKRLAVKWPWGWVFFKTQRIAEALR